MIMLICLTAIFSLLLLLTSVFKTGKKTKDWLRIIIAVLVMLIGVRLCVDIFRLAWAIATLIMAAYLALLLYAAVWIDKKLRDRDS